MELKKREDGTYMLGVRSYGGPPLTLFILNTLNKDDFETAFNRHGYKIVERHSGAGEFRITIKKD